MRPARLARLGLQDTMTDSCLARGHLRCSLSTPSPFVQVPPTGRSGASDPAHIEGTFRSGLSSPTPPQYCLLASANAASGGHRRAKLACAKGVQNNMTFTVGETVVYPNHGAAVIEDIETRQIKGEDKLYLVLRIVGQSDLVVRVPACNLDLVGVRDVVDADGLERVFGVLRAPHTEEPTNWSRRYKANLEKLHSGNVLKVAEVVRDLWRRERERGLSAGEKRMLAKARQILVSELALAERVEEDKAEVLLDEVLAS